MCFDFVLERWQPFLFQICPASALALFWLRDGGRRGEGGGIVGEGRGKGRGGGLVGRGGGVLSSFLSAKADVYHNIGGGGGG